MRQYFYRTVSILLAFVMTAWCLTGCVKKAEENQPSTEPTLNLTESVITIGEEVILTLQNGTGTTNNWRLVEPGIAKLTQINNDKCSISGIAEGTVHVHCETQIGNKKVNLICVITVIPNSFTLLPSYAILQYGQAIDLQTNINLTSKLVWSSNNNDVVTISDKGRATAVGVGSAVITASIKAREDINAVCSLTVLSADGTGTNTDANALSIIPSGVELAVGSSLMLQHSGASGTLTWSTANNKIATVDSDGILTVLSVGTVTITAKTTGGQSAQCKVTAYKPPEQIAIRPESSVLSKGGTAAFSIVTSPTDASKKVKWSSSNKNIATVDSDGKVKMVGTGKATITAQSVYNSVKGTASVATGAPATSITASHAKLTVVVGQSFGVTAAVKPENAAISDYTTTISDTSIIAKDNENGTFIAKKAGSATITFRSKDGGYTATCVVTVQHKATSANINPSILHLSIGETGSFTLDVEPDNAYAAGTWRSADPSIATVKQDGTVTGVSSGTVNIQYVFASGNLTVTAVAVVKTPIELNKKNLELTAGDAYNLNALPSIEGAWSSSDASIATVDQNGNVSALSSGSVTITFNPTDAQYENAVCQLKVWALPTSVELDKDVIYLKTGGTSTVAATVQPSKTANQSGIWTVNGSDIISITQEGVITAKKNGVASVTFTTVDGNAHKTCPVYVGERAAGVTLDPDTAAIEIDGKKQLSTVFSPTGVANKNGSWKSSSTAVATVSSAGLVTGVSAGTAVITFKSDDGGFTATCTVTVDSDSAYSADIYKIDGNVKVTGETVNYSASMQFEMKLTPKTDSYTTTWSVVGGEDEGVILGSSGDKCILTISGSKTVLIQVKVKIGTKYYSSVVTVVSSS